MSENARARGSYPKSEATRAQIVSAAFEVFSRETFDAASIRMVAEAVGLSQAGVLHHFANKADLLDAVLAMRDEHSQRVIDSVVDETGLSVMHALLALVRVNMAEPGLVELHTVLAAESTRAGHPARAHYVERLVTLRAMLTTAFADMGDRGQLAAGVDPASAAARTISMLDGLQLQWLFDRRSLDMHAELKAHLQSLCIVAL